MEKLLTTLRLGSPGRNQRSSQRFTLALLLALVVHVAATPNSSSSPLQDKTISGTIVDENDQPLPGATVMVKGTTQGTTANFDGEFSLTLPSGSEILVVTYIGYLTQEIAPGSQSELQIQPLPDATNLQEVVVICYGTQKKNDLVGAISSVKSEERVLSSTPSIGQALQGRVSGLQIVQNSAQPGGGQDIRIRGAASINASNQPLIVVDGFP